MSTKEPHPRTPKVGEFVSGHGKLIATHDITPPVERRTGYVFEDHEATITMRVNGYDVKDFGTFHALWGVDSCLNNAIEEAENIAKKLSGDNTEFVVIHKTYYSCKVPDPFRPNIRDKAFHEFMKTNDAYQVRDQIPEDRSVEHWSSTRGFLNVEDSVEEIPDRYKVFGPEECPKPCVECPDRKHHWIDTFDDEHEAFLRFNLAMFYVCKHCDAWTPEIFDPEESNCQSCRKNSTDWGTCRECGIIICKKCAEKHCCRCIPF